MDFSNSFNYTKAEFHVTNHSVYAIYEYLFCSKERILIIPILGNGVYQYGLALPVIFAHLPLQGIALRYQLTISQN
jgi:hypothetical protein